MADLISIRCPKCKAKLKLKNRSAIGKKVPCPKCKQPFVVKPLPKPEDEPDFLSELDSFDEDYGLPDEDYGGPALPPIPGRRTSSRQGSRKRSQSTNWQKPALIAGGSLLGVVVLVGLIWVSVSALSGSGNNERLNKLNLAYLPPDSELVVSVRIAEAWKSPILRSLVNKPGVLKSIDEIREKIGLEPTDIESVIVGASGLSERERKLRAQQKNRVGGQQPRGLMSVLRPDLEGLTMIAVVRTSKAFDKQKFLDYAEKEKKIPIEKIETATHRGETYYRIPSPGKSGAGFGGAFFPNDKTIVLGSEKDLKSAIERGSTVKVRPELDFIDLDQHVLFAFVPKDRSAFAKRDPMPLHNASEAQQKLQEAMNKSLHGFSFGLTLTDGIDFQLQMDCTDSDRAGQINTHLKEVLDESLAEGRRKIAETKKQFAGRKQATPPVWLELLEVAEAVIDSVRSEQSSTMVVVKAAVPASAGSTLAKIPQAITNALPRGLFGAPAAGSKFTTTRNQRPYSPGTGATPPDAGATFRPRTGVQDVPEQVQTSDLEPANFAGHEAPATLQFVKLVPDADFPNASPKVRVRVINHADKAIRSLEMKFEYLDQDGKKIKDWPYISYSGPPSFRQGSPAIVVAGNQEEEFDAHAFFMPEETKTVVVVLKKVLFVDAEEWPPNADSKPRGAGNR
jgi:hypothetical protein